jgi:hypothetical protein
LNVSDRSIASETPSANPWDAIVVDTEDSEEDATEDTILPIRKQVSEYLKEKRIPLKSDPLSNYWAMKKDCFDIISPLVRKYLSAPPASTSVNTKRLSPKPENLESNIFLNYNLRALCVASKEDVKEEPENFVAPNSTCNELPATVSGNEPDDEINLDIVMSSDEEADEGEAPDSLVFLSLFGLQLPLTFCNLLLMK